jgi:crossover junction endodeoxyribonuclease RuvC
MEKVHAVRGSSAKGTFTFGKNVGNWEGILHSCGIEWSLISPREWQEDLILPKKRLPRKRALKKLAQRLVDTTDTRFNVTLYTADAILIAKFFKDKGGNNGTK